MMQDNNTKETNNNDFGYYDYSDEPVYGDIEMGTPDNDSESVVSNHSTKIRKSRSYPTNNNLAVIKKNISNQLTTFNEMLNTQGSEMFASMPIQTNSPKSAKHSEPMPIRPFVMPLWFPSWENIKSDKIEWLNRLLSIFLHISLMISFEIMFYFKYIIDIEKTEILGKLSNYIDSLNESSLSTTQQLAIKTFFNSEDFQTFYAELYDQYRQSLHKQHEVTIMLLKRSLSIASAFYCAFFVFLALGLYKKNKRQVKWKWIIAENVCMFVLLGIFEYIFFTQIILNYNPLTDAEIKYYVVRDTYEKFD
jgi:hypothetical protein